VIYHRLALELTLLLGAALAVAVWQRDRGTPGRLCFVWCCLCVMTWCGADALLLRGVVGEPLSDALKYLGSLFIAPAWFGFAASAAGTTLSRRVPWFPLILALPAACTYPLLFSARFAPLFQVTVTGGPDLHGPLWYFAIVYSQGLVAAGCVLCAITAFRWRRPGHFVRRLALGVAPGIPLAGSALYFTDLLDGGFDPTPFLLVFALLALRSAVFRGGLLEPLPVSQRELVHQLPLGVLVTDSTGAVVEINDVAAARLGLFERQALGHPLDALVGRPGARLRRQPLVRRGRRAGEVVLVE